MFKCPNCNTMIRDEAEQIEKCKLIELVNETATIGLVNNKWLTKNKVEEVHAFNLKLLFELMLYAEVFGREWEEMSLFKRKIKGEQGTKKTRYLLGFRKNNRWVMLAGKERYGEGFE